MSARVATTANITLNNTTTTVDGVTLANGDLVLVKNQTTGTQNGLYVASTSGAWTRSALLPSGISAYKKTFYVTSGTVNQQLNFRCVITPAVIGTDSIVFMAYDNALLNNLSATVAPSATDDNSKGYSVGSVWINTTANAPYTCTNSGTGVAVWSQGGTGDVVGPASSTDKAITRFNGTSGKLVQDSAVTISDAAIVAGVKTLSMTDSTTNTITITPASATTSYALTLPAAQGAASTFLQNNGSGALSWTAAVTGPASATDTALAIYNGTTGKIIQNSVVTLSSGGAVAGVKSLSLTDSTTNTITITPAAATTTYALTLPAAQGGSGSVLTNNGSGTLSWGTTIATATNLSGATADTVPYQSAASTTSYYTYNQLNGALSGASATQTIYLSNLNGSDSYNGLSPQTSVATLGKALTLVQSGGIIKVNRSGTAYTETVSITAQNITIMSDAYNGSVAFTGTITVANTASNVCLKGISIATLVHSGAGALYIFNCTVTTAFSSTSSGYLSAYDSDFQGSGTTTVSITGTGSKVFGQGCYLGSTTINNANALVGMYNFNNSLIVTVTAGLVSINNGVVYSASAGANALSVASGGIAYLQNVNFTIAGTVNPALINIASGAFYSEWGVVRSASSTISGTNISRLFYYDNTSALTSILRGSTSGLLTIAPAATTTSYTITMPATVGTASKNNYLINNGSGVMSWSTALPLSGSTSGTFTQQAAATTTSYTATWPATVGTASKNNYLINDGSGVLSWNTALPLSGSTSGTLTQQAAATTTSYTVTWPAAQGSASTVLTNDGSGGLSWGAGGGGGGGSTEQVFTSLTAGNAGDIVQLDVSGKVKSIIETTAGTAGTVASYTGPTAISGDSTNNPLYASAVVGGYRVMAYYSTRTYAQVSTLNGASWGTAVAPTGVANNITTAYYPYDLFEIDSTRFGLLVGQLGTANTSWIFVIGTIAGMAITFSDSAAVTLPGNYMTRASLWGSKLLYSCTNTQLNASTGSGNGFLQTYTINANNTLTSDSNAVSPSFSGTLYGFFAVPITSTKAAFIFILGSGTYVGQFDISLVNNSLTISGTTLANNPTSGVYAAGQQFVPYDSTRGTLFYTTLTQTIYAAPYTFGSAGTTPTLGTTQSISLSAQIGANTLTSINVLNVSTNNVEVVFTTTGNSYINSIFLSTSSYPTITYVASSIATYSTGVTVSVNPQSTNFGQKGLAIYSGGKSSIQWFEPSLSNKLTAIVQTLGNTTYVNKTKAMGILKTSVLANNTVTVILIGGSASVYTGLTVGGTYYIGDDGRPTATVNSYPFGIALSATQLQYNPIFPIPTITTQTVYNYGSLITDGIGCSVYTNYTGSSDNIIRYFTGGNLTYSMDASKFTIGSASSLLVYPGLATASAPSVLSGLSMVYPDTTLGTLRLSVNGSAFASLVIGPASSTANAVARYSGTSGTTVKDSGVTLSDTADLAGVKTLALAGTTSGTLTLQPAATTTSYTLTMPGAQGANGTTLINNGSGILSWATGGSVSGPGSSTDTALVRWNGTAGTTLQNSGVTLSATQDLVGAKTFGMAGATSGTLTLKPAATTTSYTVTMPGAQGTANTYLLNDGSGGLSWAQGTSGNLLNVQTFISASGTFTYTPTAGTNRALVYVVGGGGSGGGAPSGVNKSCGAGGAGGGCQVGLFAIDTALTGTVVIGAGGVGALGGLGTSGSSSSFTFNGSTITGAGGSRGSNAQNANLTFLNPPVLATGSSSAINTVLLNTYTVYGSIPPRGELYAATNTLYSGVGGNSAMGGGANANGLAGNTTGADGNAGKDGVGGGGSGAYQTNGTAFTGGAGGFGGVYIFEYTNNTVTTQLTTEYLMGNLSATVTTNITDGNHAPFNQVFQSSNGSTNTGNISLDTTSAYSSGTNTASIGRITLKVGSTYSLMGIIKSLGDVSYYGYSWYNSDTNVRIGTRGESFSATQQMANAASNPSYSTYTPSVDTRVELRLTESATGTIVNWYNGSGGFGETMFNISVVKVTNGQTVFGGSTSVSAGSQGLVPAPSAGQQNYFLQGDGAWQNGVYVQTTAQRNADTASINNYFYNNSTAQLEYYNGSNYLTNSTVTITTTAQTGALTDRLVIFNPPSSTALTYTLPDASVTYGTTIRYQISSTATTANASVVISPQGGQTVGGGSSFTLACVGDFVVLVSNGTDWVISAKPTGRLLIASQTVSAVSSVTFDNIFASKYYSYYFEISMLGGASGTGLFTNTWRLRSGGATITTASYGMNVNYFGPTAGTPTNTGVASWGAGGLQFYNSNGPGDQQQITGTLMNPQSATQYRQVSSSGSYTYNGTSYSAVAIGYFAATTPSVDGFIYTVSSGTASGTIRWYANCS